MIFLGKEVHNFGEPFIVAEISCNHMGNFSKALSLIEAAKDAGVDAVKVQCYEADDLTLNNGYVIGGGTPWKDETLYELYKKATTPLEWMPELFEHAKFCEIPIFSSVYSERGLDILSGLNAQAYKIASYEANDLAFIHKVLSKGKPVVISVGTLSEAEIHTLLQSFTPEQLDRVILLHCVSKYPCSIEELGLGTMAEMIEEISLPIGFSCHSDNPNAVFLASALGAAMVEVHLALEDQESSESPDWDFSFLPDMLAHAVKHSKKAYKAIRIKDSDIEAPAREFKRSLYVIKDIYKDEVVTQEHIGSFRPNLGCSPHLLPNIIGRKVNRTLRANEPMKMEYLE